MYMNYGRNAKIIQYKLCNKIQKYANMSEYNDLLGKKHKLCLSIACTSTKLFVSWIAWQIASHFRLEVLFA